MKRKKVTRQRGSKTHGWGSMKKHRGAGNRGGRGLAGTGKRADTRKPSIWKAKYFGPLGFTPRKKDQKTVNLSYFDASAERLVKQGKAKLEGDTYILDLKQLGFDKLLSKGVVNKRYKIHCDSATPRAIEKVKAKGGEVVTAKDVSVESNTHEPA